MVLDASLLNIQYYKVRIKGKVEQSREKEWNPSVHFRVVAIEKINLLYPLGTVQGIKIWSYNANGICTNRSSNRIQKIRSNFNYQENRKSTCHLSDFAVPAEHKIKVKESEKKWTNPWILLENGKSCWIWRWWWDQLHLRPDLIIINKRKR